MTPNSLEDCRQADAQDPLRELRHQFDLPDGVAGFKPTVKLEYSHSNANGPYG